MWEESDQPFIQFWYHLLSIAPYLIISLGGFLIVTALGWTGIRAFSDAFSTQAHYFDSSCSIILFLLVIGSLLVWRGRQSG